MKNPLIHGFASFASGLAILQSDNWLIESLALLAIGVNTIMIKE